MAGIILSSICAIALSTAALPASADTTNVFIIDNVEVKGFNGSQLNGKTISAYEIVLSEVGSKTVRTHLIKTAPFGNTVSYTMTETSPGTSPDELVSFFRVDTSGAVIFLDGKLVSEAEFNAVDVSKITSLEELKGQSAADYLRTLKDEGKYDGATEGRGVLVVTTSQGK
jgi:hypothetical protein